MPVPYRRTWGFRLSMIDVVILALSVSVPWLLRPSIGSMAGVIPVAVFHFLLFCNVFRIRRWKELAWAGVFLLNAGTWFVYDQMWWPGVLAIQTPVTVALIWTETRQPWYHGILARRWNPRLQDYLEGRT